MATHMNAEREVGREDNNQYVINNFDSLEKHVLASAIPRKRGKYIENHERQRVKKLRYSGGGKEPQIGCLHTARGNAILCHADKLTDNIMGLNHDKFYEKTDKVVQDSYLLTLLNITLPNRRRNRVENEDNRKNINVSVRYTLLGENLPNKIPVCKATFIKVLGEF